MALDSRIKGTDIFDKESVAAAFARYKQHIDSAITSTNALKTAILEMNRSFTSGEVRAMAEEIRKLTTAVNNTVDSQKKLASTAEATTKKLAEQAKKIRKVTEEAGKLDTTINKGGGGGGSIGGLMKMVGWGAVIAALYKLGKEIYSVAKAIDTMELTLRKVTESTYEFNYALDFVSKTSDKFGMNILETSKKFATFRASAKESNLTLRETMDVFEKFSAVGANLGLSQDGMNRVFLALEQMLSKGTVSSEELRRQLGEVLPGAVAIMAKSMGKGTAELQKMLQAGEVLTKDVMPAFADEFLKTFNVDITKGVDTLIANENRMKNSWINFVTTITDSEGILYKAISGILGMMTKFMDTVNESTKNVGYLFEKLYPSEKLKENWLVKAAKDAYKWYNDTLSIMGYIKRLNKETTEEREAKDDYTLRIEAYERLYKVHKQYMLLMEAKKETPIGFEAFLGDRSLQALRDGNDELDLLMKKLLGVDVVADKIKDKNKEPILKFEYIDPDAEFAKYLKAIEKFYDDIATLEKNGYNEQAELMREQHGLQQEDYIDFLNKILQDTKDLTPQMTAAILEALTPIAKKTKEVTIISMLNNILASIILLWKIRLFTN